MRRDSHTPLPKRREDLIACIRFHVVVSGGFSFSFVSYAEEQQRRQHLKHLSGGGHRRTTIKPNAYLPPPSDEQQRPPRAIRSPSDEQRRWRPSRSGDFGTLGPRLGRRQGGEVGRWEGGEVGRWQRRGTRGASKASGALAILLLDKNPLLDKYLLLDKNPLLDKCM